MRGKCRLQQAKWGRGHGSLHNNYICTVLCHYISLHGAYTLKCSQNVNTHELSSLVLLHHDYC